MTPPNPSFSLCCSASLCMCNKCHALTQPLEAILEVVSDYILRKKIGCRLAQCGLSEAPQKCTRFELRSLHPISKPLYGTKLYILYLEAILLLWQRKYETQNQTPHPSVFRKRTTFFPLLSSQVFMPQPKSEVKKTKYTTLSLF